MSQVHLAELVLMVEEVAVRRYLLGAGRYVIGRSAQADIPIDDKAVSSQHALLSIEPQREGQTSLRCILEDLDSTNGTLVRGEPIVRTLLRNGDDVRIASNRFCFLRVSPQRAPKRRASSA